MNDPPDVERELDHFERLNQLLQTEVRNIIRNMENFLSSPFDGFQIPNYPSKILQSILSKTTNLLNEKAVYDNQPYLQKYKELRNKCFEVLKKQIKDFKKNSNLRILIIVPSSMEQEKESKDTDDDLQEQYQLNSDTESDDINTPSDKESIVKNSTSTTDTQKNEKNSYSQSDITNDNIQNPNITITNYEDFSVAFFLRHMFHYSYFLDYSQIIITSSENANFQIFRKIQEATKPLTTESAKKYLSPTATFSEKELCKLPPYYYTHFITPLELHKYFDFSFVQVSYNMINFLIDGPISNIVFPFNQYFLEELQSTNESNLLVFFIDHGTHGSFGPKHSYEYYLKEIKKIPAKSKFFFVDCCNSSYLIELFNIPQKISDTFQITSIKKSFPNIPIVLPKIQTGIFQAAFQYKKRNDEKSFQNTTATDGETKQSEVASNEIITVETIIDNLNSHIYTNDDKKIIKYAFEKNPSFFESDLYLHEIRKFTIYSDIEINKHFSNNLTMFCSSFQNSYPMLKLEPMFDGERIFMDQFFGTFYMSIILSILFFDPPKQFTHQDFQRKVSEYANTLRLQFQSLAEKQFGSTPNDKLQVETFFNFLGDPKLSYCNYIKESENVFFNPYISFAQHAITTEIIPVNSYKDEQENSISRGRIASAKLKSFKSYLQENANKLLKDFGFPPSFDAFDGSPICLIEEYVDWKYFFLGNLPCYPNPPWSILVDHTAAATGNYINNNSLQSKYTRVCNILARAFKQTKKEHPNVRNTTFLC